MNNLNFVFFEEYKRLEVLCNDMYQVHNGVTQYIENMKSVPYYDYCSIAYWDSDLKNLKRLRHIRNHLSHTPGAFAENICTLNDIRWLQNFHRRILAQTDPLALLHNKNKVTPGAQTTKKNNIITLISIFLILLGVLSLFLIYIIVTFVY